MRYQKRTLLRQPSDPIALAWHAADRPCFTAELRREGNAP